MNKNEKITAPENKGLTAGAQSGNEAVKMKNAAENDLRSEMMALIERYDEVREMMEKGEGLPEEVIDACVKEGISLQLAYAEYAMRAAQRQAQKLREENAVLRQNAANAAKAPVKGAAHGAANQQGKDPFLEGLFAEN